MSHTLYLMRHGHAVSWDSAGDQVRPLDENGRRQAASIGGQLLGAGLTQVYTSPATRCRQTVDCLVSALGPRARVEVEEVKRLYGAGSNTILTLIQELDDDLQTVLVCGHNPGIGSLVYDLADPRHSDAAAQQAIASRFPTATCCQLVIDGSWSALREGKARLVTTWRPLPN